MAHRDYNHLKVTLGVFLTGYTVAVVTYYVGKMFGDLSDTIIVVPNENSGSNDP